MINTEVRVIKLSCVGCGSNLDISQSVNRLACGHCGTQQIVERSGGAIHLKGFAEAISKVQVGTDKTAAELAIVRLTRELETVQCQRAEKEQYWLNIRTKKLYDWNTFLESKKKSVNAAIMLSGILALIPSLFIASIVFKILALISESIAMLPAVAVFLAGCIFAVVSVRKWIYNSNKFSPEKLQKDCNKEFAELDWEITKDLGEADNRIVALNAKIQQNYHIANS